MWSRRLFLVLLLSVSVDLGATVLPAAHGVAWDDDEEAVHARRASQSPRRIEDRGRTTPTAHALASPVRGDASAGRPDRRVDRAEPHREADAAQRDPAAPGEDH